MKLSMWMIANRLKDCRMKADIISKNNPSFRNVAPKEHCVQLTREGSDILCSGDGDRITLYDLDFDSAFRMIADIFDEYNDFEDSIKFYAKNFDFEKIVEMLWDFFNNPIIFFDMNFNVLAMSKQHYGMDELNSEWQHIYKYGCSSFDVVSRFREGRYETLTNLNLQFYHFNSPNEFDYVISPVSFNNMDYGSISVLQKDRMINYGDEQLLNYVTSIIAPELYRYNAHESSPLGINYLLKLLMGHSVNQTDIARWQKYVNWLPQDPVRVCILQPIESNDAPVLLTIIKEYCIKLLPEVPAFIYQNQIILVINESRSAYKTAIGMLNSAVRLENKFTVSCSLPFKQLEYIKTYWHQAIFAANYGQKNKTETPFYDFYDYALDYIIYYGNENEKFCACHPDIMAMYISDKSNATNLIDTFSAYLENERSLVHTADALFIHRNTLVYRIKKIFDEFIYSIDDSYTREYMSLSIRMLKIHETVKEHLSLNEPISV